MPVLFHPPTLLLFCLSLILISIFEIFSGDLKDHAIRNLGHFVHGSKQH